MNLEEIKQKQSGLYKHRTIVCLLPKAVIVAASVSRNGERANTAGTHARIAKVIGKASPQHLRSKASGFSSQYFPRKGGNTEL